LHGINTHADSARPGAKSVSCRAAIWYTFRIHPNQRSFYTGSEDLKESPMERAELQQQFVEAERLVEVQSKELKKELRLGDLVLSQTLYIIGIQWLGTAGLLGSAHVMYWIPAVLLFYIPSGMVVIHLSKEMPLEGGMYQWAKLRFGELAGFLVALNLWATVVLVVGSMLSILTDNIGYAAGPAGGWIVESKLFNAAVSATVMGGMALITTRGLSLAKWIHNLGGLVLVSMIGAMLVFAVPRWIHGNAVSAPGALVFPAVTLLNLNVAAKMGFGAFCGFDGMCIFAGEIRNPQVARTLRRSIFLSGPLIAFIYILGTASVLAFTKPADLDLISPPTQALLRGAQGTVLAGIVAPLMALLLIIAGVGGTSLYSNSVIRLPMVAGWDHLLPGWLSRLHPRFKTPVGSIICVAGATFTLTLLGHLGVGAQEAFQFLNNTGIICWALTYLVMFAIPLIGSGEKAPLTVRVAAASGFLMTLLYVALSTLPVVEVRNSASFTARVAIVILGINSAGVWYFRRATRHRAARAVAV
jgi:amino acid transporter